jgi:hypothetical protein
MLGLNVDNSGERLLRLRRRRIWPYCEFRFDELCGAEFGGMAKY